MSDHRELLDQVRELRQQGRSPKQIAKLLGLPQTTVNPLIRQVAGRRSGSATSSSASADAVAPADRPLLGCWVSPGWSAGLGLDHVPPEWVASEPSSEEDPEIGGLANVLIAREARPGRATFCGFLVDAYCLGVKNVIGPFEKRSAEILEVRSRLFSAFDVLPSSVPIELAQHLVHGAVAYARSLGFEPHHEFVDAAPYLGDAVGPTPIQFGREGQPFYICGPDDDVSAVLRTLRAAVGEGNYHFIAPMNMLPE